MFFRLNGDEYLVIVAYGRGTLSSVTCVLHAILVIYNVTLVLEIVNIHIVCEVIVPFCPIIFAL